MKLNLNPDRAFKKTLPLCLALTMGFSLVLSSCAPGTSLMGPSGSSTSQSSADVRGEIVLPYRVQDAKVSSLPNPVSYFLGEPAIADDLYIVPVTRTDLNRVQAYVNGTPVNIRITDMRISGDQTVLSYQIDTIPLLNPNAVNALEIRLASGEPLVGGVLTFVPGTVNTYNLTVQTTALLDSVREVLGTRPITDITIVRVREIERGPGLNGRLNAIKSILQRNGKLRYTTLNRFVLDSDFDDDDCNRADIKYKEKKGKVDIKIKCD